MSLYHDCAIFIYVHSYHCVVGVTWFSDFHFPAITDALFLYRGVMVDDGFMPDVGMISEKNEIAEFSSFKRISKKDFWVVFKKFSAYSFSLQTQL